MMQKLAGQGLNMQAVFDLQSLPESVLGVLRENLDDVQSFRQLLLFGNGGSLFWQTFQKANVSGQNPVDDFSSQLVSDYLCESLPEANFRILYPGLTSIGLQQLGKLAGWHHTSPLMIGINAHWGLWFAYRVVVISDTQLPLTASDKLASPCDSCLGKPCIAACPADALQSGSFELPRCVAFRRSVTDGVDSLCATTCLARLRCPVAPQHRYSDEQIHYHYGRSLRTIRRQR